MRVPPGLNEPPAWPAWAIAGMLDDIRPTLARAQAAGEDVAVATLFASEGGAMRGLGAQMLIGHDGLLAGHLTGGCADADIAAHAAAAWADGTARRLVYGQGGPWDLPLPCGGRIEVFVERVPAADPALAELLRRWTARQPSLWRSDGVVRLCTDDEGGVEAGDDAGTVFRRFAPATRMVVIGGEPTALAVAALAAMSGLESWLVRPGGPDAPPPIESVRYLRTEAGAALAEIGIDRWTAIAVCTHDAEMDHQALVAALPTSAFYVGALGSARRRRARLAALAQAGVASEALARLRTPIGFAIGARAPFEIATATLAEIIEARRAAESGRLANAA